MERYFGRFATFFLMAMAQALVTAFGCLYFVGMETAEPALFVLACCLCSLNFASMNYALVYALDNVGMALSVVIMVIQVAGSGGSYPVHVLPQLFQTLYPFMPFHYGMDMIRETVGGMYGDTYLRCALVLLGGVMSRLPLSALAGVLMVTAWRMNEWHGIKTIFSRKVWTGVAQFLITMVSTVVFDLTVAIVIGIVTALLMFVWNAARLTIETEPVDKVRLERLHRMGKPVDESRAKSILVSYVNGSLFFANCAELKRKLLSVDFTGCEHLILSLRGVSATDISGVQTLMEVCALIAQKGVTVSICGVHELSLIHISEPTRRS